MHDEQQLTCLEADLLPSIKQWIHIKEKTYAFWHQFDEKPSIIPGCPGIKTHQSIEQCGCHAKIKLVVKSKAHLFQVLDSPSKVVHLLVCHATLCMTLCLRISVRGQVNGMLQVLQEKHTAQHRGLPRRRPKSSKSMTLTKKRRLFS